MIFDGEGVMDVQKVGLQTMMGKMAEEMQEEEPDSPLKVKLSKLADQISKFGYIGAIVIAVMYFVYFIIMSGIFFYGTSKGCAGFDRCSVTCGCDHCMCSTRRTAAYDISCINAKYK